MWRIAAAATLIAGVFASACGDDDGVQPEIRTQTGLGVGLLAENAERVRDLAEAAARGDEGAGGADAGAPSVSEVQRDTGIAARALQQAAEGITVSGYGVATAAADLALIEFYFGTYAVRPETSDETGGGTSSQVTDGAPITESDLQPVIDAVVAAGVPREDIEFLTGAYYDYYWSYATLRVRVTDVDALDTVVNAAVGASQSLTDFTLQSTSASYMVQDCAPLERAALQAAVEDAGQRAGAFADVLAVSRGPIVAAYDYAYSPFGGSACDVGYAGPYPLGGATYSEGQSREVQVYTSVLITYAIQ